MIGLEYIVKEFHTTYKEVARKLGISSPAMQYWLKNKKKIPEKRLEQLSQIFNLPEAYFQKELTFMEKGEIRISYLKSISEEAENLMTEEEEEQVIYYGASSYQDEIQFLESLLETKKKQQRLKKEIDDLTKQEALRTPSDKDVSSPLHTAFSNTDAIYQTTEILKNEQAADYFKVMVYLMNQAPELGGKPETKVVPKYSKFARDFRKLWDEHQPEQQQVEESLDHE